MAQFSDVALTDGTRFIVHRHGGNIFVFETRDAHILSVSIDSASIESFYNLLGRGGDQYGKSVGEIGPPKERHDAMHEAGISYGLRHSHWGSLRNSAADGYTLLALLYDRLGGAANTISDLVKHG